MGFFDSIASAIGRIFTLPGGSSPAPAPAAPPPAPVAPPLPTILQSPLTPAPTVVMPTLTSGAAAAKAQTQALMARQGRSSTILTTRKKRQRPASTSFDSYSGTSL